MIIVKSQEDLVNFFTKYYILGFSFNNLEYFWIKYETKIEELRKNNIFHIVWIIRGEILSRKKVDREAQQQKILNKARLLFAEKGVENRLRRERGGHRQMAARQSFR